MEVNSSKNRLPTKIFGFKKWKKKKNNVLRTEYKIPKRYEYNLIHKLIVSYFVFQNWFDLCLRTVRFTVVHNISFVHLHILIIFLFLIFFFFFIFLLISICRVPTPMQMKSAHIAVHINGSSFFFFFSLLCL